MPVQPDGGKTAAPDTGPATPQPTTPLSSVAEERLDMFMHATGLSVPDVLRAAANILAQRGGAV